LQLNKSVKRRKNIFPNKEIAIIISEKINNKILSLLIPTS